MTGYSTTAVWWRPELDAAETRERDHRRTNRIAFGALLAFTAILVISPQAWFPVLRSLRIAFLAAGFAILAYLLDRAVRRQSGPVHPEMALAAALVGWAVMTVPLSLWPGGSVAELTDHFLKAVVFFWLLGALVTTRERLRVFAWLLVGCSVPLAVTAISNYQSGVFVTSPNRLVQRIAGYNMEGSGLAANPNDLALMLNLTVPLAAALASSARGISRRALAAGALGLSVTAVILTFSRAGFLSLTAIALLWIVAAARRKPFAALVAALVIVVGVPSLLPGNYLARLETITDISSDPTGSAQGRWTDLTVSAELVARNPLTGVGLGQNILALNRERGPTWRTVHNVYLQYAVDLGLPGLLLFLWLFTAIFRAARRGRQLGRRDPAYREIGLIAEGVEISLVAFAIAAFFHPVAYQFYFFCLAGLALGVRNAIADERRRLQPVDATP